jgi:hypothetical protein
MVVIALTIATLVCSSTEVKAEERTYVPSGKMFTLDGDTYLTRSEFEDVVTFEYGYMDENCEGYLDYTKTYLNENHVRLDYTNSLDEYREDNQDDWEGIDHITAAHIEIIYGDGVTLVEYHADAILDDGTAYSAHELVNVFDIVDVDM